MLDDGPQPDRYGNRGQLIKTWKFRGYEFTMEVAYIPADDEEEERMQFFVTMPDKMYFYSLFLANCLFPRPKTVQKYRQ